MHINCGGIATTIGNIEFEEDQDLAGDANFVSVGNSWGLSSSGIFWDVNITSDQYKATNVSILRMNNSELYTSARLSPLSLTYYARCLANGNYTVKLYFAEIVFRDNRSFYSLGRRIFDVYIQVWSHICFAVSIESNFIELICYRNNGCWRISILKMLQKGLVKQQFANLKQLWVTKFCWSAFIGLGKGQQLCHREEHMVLSYQQSL